jgi:hypothetical protein
MDAVQVVIRFIMISDTSGLRWRLRSRRAECWWNGAADR